MDYEMSAVERSSLLEQINYEESLHGYGTPRISVPTCTLRWLLVRATLLDAFLESSAAPGMRDRAHKGSSTSFPTSPPVADYSALDGAILSALDTTSVRSLSMILYDAAVTQEVQLLGYAPWRIPHNDRANKLHGITRPREEDTADLVTERIKELIKENKIIAKKESGGFLRAE
jgi:hypothetical protein